MSPSKTTVTPRSPALARSNVSFVRRVARHPWSALAHLTAGAEIFFRVGPSSQLRSWVREFDPEVIYGQACGLKSALQLRQMQQALGLPLVMHLLDDYREIVPYADTWVGKLKRSRLEVELRKLVRSADTAIAICQETATEFENRYQRPVHWLPMPVDLDAYKACVRTQWAASRPFRIRYGGRLGWAIRESVTDIAQEVHELRKQGTDVLFDVVTVSTDQARSACRALTGVNVQFPGPLAEVPHLQAEADLLVICYDFDPKSARQARYSMPSKMADCMASGTPILVYGPAGLPVVEYARRESWAMVVDRRDPTALRTALCDLMGSAALRERLARNAQRLATERHDAKSVSEDIRRILADAATRRPRCAGRRTASPTL